MHGEIEDECPENGKAPGVRDGVEVLCFRVDGWDGPIQGRERWGRVVDGCGAAVLEMMMMMVVIMIVMLTPVEDAVMMEKE